MKIRFAIALLILFSGLFAQSQQVEKGFELLQILKISQVYKDAPNLSFDITYTYADSASPSTILEELTGASKISSGKYWTFLDSVEFIQGNTYNLAVYYFDSSIIVNDKQEYGNMMQLPFLDSLFRQSNVDSMDIVVVDDSTHLFTVHFSGASPYRVYKLWYDSNKFLIKKVEYYLKEVPMDNGGLSTALVTLVIDNYSDMSIDQEIFREDKFMYKHEGEFFAKPAYQGFRIINNSYK